MELRKAHYILFDSLNKLKGQIISMSKKSKKSKKKNKRYKGHRVTKAILLILIILLIMVAGVIAGGWNYVEEILGKINHEAIDTSQIGE